MMIVICNKWIDEAKGWRCGLDEGHHGGCVPARPNYSTTGTNTVTEPYTLKKLKEAIAAFAGMPPAPFFASSRLFPDNAAIRFKWKGRDFCGAGPGFWQSVADQMPEFQANAGLGTGLGAIEIVDLDLSRNEALRDEFMGTLSLALDATP